MKKILLFGLACVLALGIFSCASEDDEKNSETEKTAKTEKTDQDDDDDKEADVLTPATAPDYASGSFTAFGSGWNLGNALDACYYVDKKLASTSNFATMEKMWSDPNAKTISEELIKAVAAKGFKTIRIPVSWHNHITADNGKYTIDKNWLARVKEIVDWSLKAGLNVIINIHHDNLTSAQMAICYGYSVNTTKSEQTTSKAYIKAIWNQVATYFKNYGDRLIFEVLNEPRNRDGDNDGFSNVQNLSALNALIKEYEKIAIDEIRATGGNNASRYLMVPPYGASPDLTEGWSLPTDSATGKLIVSVHAYTPYTFALGDATNKTFEEDDEGAAISQVFENIKTKWRSNGIRVVMGEASATDKKNTDERMKWIEYYYTKAKDLGVPVLAWDNGHTWASTANTADRTTGECHGYLNRNDNSWFYPTLVEKMVELTTDESDETKTVTVDEEDEPGTDDPESGETDDDLPSKIIWEGSQDLKHWNGADGITIEASAFENVTTNSYLEFTISKGAECTASENGSPCSNNYSTIHPITSWENGNIDATTDTTGANVNNSKQLDVTNVVPETGSVTVNYKPSDWTAIKQNGMIIYGHKVVITKVTLFGFTQTDSTLSSLSSKEFAQKLTIGWNLGNTLDAASYGSITNLGLSTETSWGMPETTEAMIKAVAAKGFKTIRIPVSWHNHITSDDGNYTIDSAWMTRVKQIIDWARKSEMFVILNIHHDNLSEAQMSSTYGFCVPENNEDLKNQSLLYIKAIWKQVADYYKEYDEHLIFEVLNEPRAVGKSYEWNGSGTSISNANKIITEYEKAAVDEIRASGGNNLSRYLMVPPYAASPNMTEGWSLPADSVDDKLLISTHAYSPYGFAMYDRTEHTDFSSADEGDLAWLFNTTATGSSQPPLKQWLDAGYGIVMGEASATDKQNDSERLKWIQSYFGHAKAAGVPVILWDNMKTYSADGNKSEFHGWLNRSSCTWFFPTLVNKMIEIATGTE